jgi:hypothetical protein
MAVWVSDFDRHRVEIGQHLITATRNVTFGDAELFPIQKIQDSLGRYLMENRAARDAHVRNDTATMLSAYRESQQIIATALVPAANDLYRINDDELEHAYIQQQTRGRHYTLLVMVVGAMAALMLVALQLYVAKSFRRYVNPALVAATLLTLGFVFYTVRAFNGNGRHLRALKEDAYDSIEALVNARSDAYETNAAESRWLLDPDRKPEHALSFTEHVARLASFTNNQTFDTAYAIARQRDKVMRQRMAKGDDAVTAGKRATRELPLAGMDGALKKALDNVTFPDPDPARDEATQAPESLRAFGVYVGLDRKIRDLENMNTPDKHKEAIGLEVDTKPGGSEWAFQQFDRALNNWIAINQDWLGRFRDAAFRDVAKLNTAAAVISLVVILLVFVGVRPRIREYG